MFPSITNYDSPVGYGTLSAQQKTALALWIVANATRFDLRRTHSDYLKERFTESEAGFYVTHGQFKGAMLAQGYQPLNIRSNKWYFRNH